MFEFKDFLLGAAVVLALSGSPRAADDNPWRMPRWSPPAQPQPGPGVGNGWGDVYRQPGFGMEYPPDDLEQQLDSQVHGSTHGTPAGRYPTVPVPTAPGTGIPEAGAVPGYPIGSGAYFNRGLPAVNDIYGPHEFDPYAGRGYYGGPTDMWPGIGYNAFPYVGGLPYSGVSGLGWPLGLGWPGIGY